MDKNVLEKIEEKINSFLDFLNQYINSEIEIPDKLLNLSIDSTKDIKEIFKKFILIMEKLFAKINLSRLHTDKIDKKYINELFPIFIFQKLKRYILGRKQSKIDAELEKFKNKPNILTKKLEELKNPQPIDYTFYLPAGNGNYLDFIRYFLKNIYKNNE
jgi:hypothetical protein